METPEFLKALETMARKQAEIDALMIETAAMEAVAGFMMVKGSTSYDLLMKVAEKIRQNSEIDQSNND